MASNALASQPQKKKYVSTSEMVFYFIGTFLMTNMQGMVNGYRQAYFINVLTLDSNMVSTINTVCSVASFALNFFLTMYIDRQPKPGQTKFKRHVWLWSIPVGIATVLHYYTPNFILANTWLILIYMIGISLVYTVSNGLAGQLNSIAVVMSPDNKERDTVLSFRGIVNAVGNSAILVVLLVAGFITKDEGLQYIGSAVISSLVGVVFMLIACSKVKERVTYESKRVNPLVGFKDVLSNKYARIVLVSEFLKSFRKISSYMGIFLAAALLGSTSKFLLFGLPTGIGTAVGMLIIKFLLNKFNSKVLYIASGVYSIIANTAAFIIGYLYFKTPNTVLLVLFIAFLFFIGLQFGASNLLPSMFQADILEDIEVKTHKRLDASIGFVCSVGATISSTIANAVAPKILYGENSIIQYIQPAADVYPEQSEWTKISMLFFYTVVHGLMMFLAGVPFFFYKLTGETKDEVHEAVMAYRAEVEQRNEQNSKAE